MLRRLLLGLSEGLVIGLGLALAFTRGLGLAAPGALVAGALGALAGFAVGLVAGRPIWARNAKTEAFLKSGAGALGGFGLSFALRRWLKIELDLSAFSLGAGSAGQLPAVVLPAVATALALFFELDDDRGRSAGELPAAPGLKRRVAAQQPGSEPAPDSEASVDPVDRKLEKH